MLPVHQNRTPVTVTVDYPSENGAVISPVSITFKVYDETGAELATATAEPPVGELGTQVSVLIDAEQNAVPDDAIRSARLVAFEFGTDNGTYTVNYRYVLEKAKLLVPMQNSFQTYEQAILTRMAIARADGWDSTEESGQIAALVSAHDRMTRLTYRYRLSQNAVAYDARDPYWIVDRMGYRTMEDYAKWPVDFRNALHRAQVLEADQILRGDPVADKRRMGVVSETIGEAKMFFNAKPPLQLMLCQPAMEVISPFLFSSRRVGRG